MGVPARVTILLVMPASFPAPNMPTPAPIPTHRPKQGRPFPTHTPLGKLTQARGWRVADLAGASGVNARTLTEYLAGRKEIAAHHRDALARALSTPGATVTPDLL